MTAHSSVRFYAARTLAKVMNGESLSKALPSVESRVENRDISLLRQLCYTTLRHWFTLNASLDLLLSKPLKAKDSDIKALLLIGLCQLRHMRIPAHAALSETVNATTPLKKTWARGLVNAILRNAQRKADDTLTLNPATEGELPSWFYGKVAKAWPEQLTSIVTGTNCHAPMTLRINASKTSRVAYLQRLKDAQIEAEYCNYSSHGIQLAEPTHVENLPGFNEGYVSVQDEAAQLSASLLSCQPGERVLDACAAPGGKTCHILENTQNLDVTALDLEPERLERVAENLKRLDLYAKLLQGDASRPEAWWDNKPFDRILLDAPCSATGVIRRHPDIKLLRRPDDIVQLAELQGKILDALWPILKPGGTMVYATCSILPQENSKQIESFLARTRNAVQDTPIMNCGLDTGYGLQLLPTMGKYDGFFYCRLKKQP